ncbi:hypothetical protein BRAO375_1870022 [Bradyrhizobium sp. ORS 375]|nr:hypothetical protein BRAO375_1870022 [Bradyrhizobium sp. ORS 375]
MGDHVGILSNDLQIMSFPGAPAGQAIVNGDEELLRRTILRVCYCVMPGLVPGIHVVLGPSHDVDGRDRPGHEDVERDECKTATVKFDSPGVRGERRAHASWACRDVGR